MFDLTDLSIRDAFVTGKGTGKFRRSAAKEFKSPVGQFDGDRTKLRSTDLRKTTRIGVNF